MERVTRHHLADVILNAPGWARVGLTMADPDLRLRAADELAGTIADRLGLVLGEVDDRTMELPLGGA
jgi:hypothetical protein